MIYFSPSTCGFYEDGQGAAPRPMPSRSPPTSATARWPICAPATGSSPGRAEGRWSRPPRSTDEVLAVVRRRRNALLAACDWTQAADSPISTTDRSAWAEYRQALRTLPETITDPASIVWPVAPTQKDPA
jgi:hypothetical protein